MTHSGLSVHIQPLSQPGWERQAHWSQGLQASGTLETKSRGSWALSGLQPWLLKSMLPALSPPITSPQHFLSASTSVASGTSCCKPREQEKLQLSPFKIGKVSGGKRPGQLPTFCDKTAVVPAPSTPTCCLLFPRLSLPCLSSSPVPLPLCHILCTKGRKT